ncbi:flagellar basal-body rod protein FlgG [Neisseriaceae bacterium TC5R-5]|nr:flagellar basal-body rod protein FlgG [Neisseriaceae bacterium TC5R-5]
MIDALYIGASGMFAQQSSLETVANNLANMNTPAFKRSQAVFADMLYRESALSSPLADSKLQPVHLGLGTRISSIDKVFSQGELHETSAGLDVAISGDGFVEVQQLDGSPAYSRAGTLRVNEEGLLALANGLALNPPISVPPEAKGLQISRNGTVSVVMANDSEPMELGQIELHMFNSPAALQPRGDGLYLATELSGSAQPGKPGEEGRGVLAQGFLEGSNVSMADELVNLMMAQRAFEASSKVIQAADEMLAMSNNLRRN